MKKQITNMLLIRDTFTKDATLGKLYINGEFFCYTLEDTVRAANIKVNANTAIPEGIYKVIITMSNRFKQKLPLIMDVLNFVGIRMHGGNRIEDTSGCILVAFNKIDDVTIQRSAAVKLTEYLIKTKKDIVITIVNHQGDLL